MKVGYARVSTPDQSTELQIDALKKAGCEKFFTDKVTGSKRERKGLEEMLAFVRSGDIIIVWKLDRLARSLQHLIDITAKLKERNIGFTSLTENIDTATPGGELAFHIFGAVAEFERALIRERVQAGVTAARARGRKGGRPRLLKTSGKVAYAKALYEDKSNSIEYICKTLGISRPTLYRYVKEERKEN